MRGLEDAGVHKVLAFNHNNFSVYYITYIITDLCICT